MNTDRGMFEDEEYYKARMKRLRDQLGQGPADHPAPPPAPTNPPEVTAPIPSPPKDEIGIPEPVSPPPTPPKLEEPIIGIPQPENPPTEEPKAEVVIAETSNPGPVGEDTGHEFEDPATGAKIRVIARIGESKDDAIKRVHAHHGIT